jgi:hypothetical protein
MIITEDKQIIVTVEDVDSLSAEDIESYDLNLLGEIAKKIVSKKEEVSSFYSRIALELDIPINYVSGIITGKRAAKKYRSEVDTRLRAMMLEYVKTQATNL